MNSLEHSKRLVREPNARERHGENYDKALAEVMADDSGSGPESESCHICGGDADNEASLLATMRDIRAWMKHRLEYGPIKHQRPDDEHYPQNQHPNGYAAVLIPDWEMKQKLANVAEALASFEKDGPEQ